MKGSGGNIPQLADALRGFITQELRFEGDPTLLTQDYPLLENRVIDSLGIFQLVTFIEERFKVTIEDDELLPEHFSSLGSIVTLVESKL